MALVNASPGVSVKPMLRFLGVWLLGKSKVLHDNISCCVANVTLPNGAADVAIAAVAAVLVRVNRAHMDWSVVVHSYLLMFKVSC